MQKDSVFRGDRGQAVEIDTKAVNETGEFEGYGSVFNVADQGMDIVMPGAFGASLSARPGVKMLWQHSPEMPIGRWVEMREDSRGLYCKGKLFLGVHQGREAYELMREGAVDGLSIGYRTKRSEMDRETGLRKLIEVDLREVSVVTFPMLEAATVSLVKGEVDAINSLSDAESFLREAGYSRKDARDFVSRVKRIAQREAGDDRGLSEAIQKLTQKLRG